MFLVVELFDTYKKDDSRCPDALAMYGCGGKYRLALRVHFRYSHPYPVKSVCSKMDTHATCANDDTVKRAKSLFLDTLLSPC
jgi:hypothetical protein